MFTVAATIFILILTADYLEGSLENYERKYIVKNENLALNENAENILIRDEINQ